MPFFDDAIAAHFQADRSAWGRESLNACDRALRHSPDFAAARFAAAMVYVARQSFGPALAAATAGVDAQKRQADSAPAFPAIGLHWLRGLLLLRERQIGLAIEAFAREIDELVDTEVYVSEIRVRAQVAAGFAHLAAQDVTGAVDVFRMSLETFPRSGRGLAGLYTALQHTSLAPESSTLLRQIDQRVVELSAAGSTGEAALVRAAAHAATGSLQDGIDTLVHLLESAPPGHVGWQIPIDPSIAPLRAHPDFPRVLSLLAARAS